MKAVFDTNILIDYLNGIDQAATELSLYSESLVSVITVIAPGGGALIRFSQIRDVRPAILLSRRFFPRDIGIRGW